MKDFTFETEITINGVDYEANVFIEVTKYVNQPGNFLCGIQKKISLATKK